jgi:hypothetical protein
MLGFDVILGMDWLLKHYLSINCKRKEVTFISPGDKEFKFGSAQVRATPPPFSAVQAKRCIEDCSHAFQACLVLKPNIEVKLEDI